MKWHILNIYDFERKMKQKMMVAFNMIFSRGPIKNASYKKIVGKFVFRITNGSWWYLHFGAMRYKASKWWYVLDEAMKRWSDED